MDQTTVNTAHYGLGHTKLRHPLGLHPSRHIPGIFPESCSKQGWHPRKPSLSPAFLLLWAEPLCLQLQGLCPPRPYLSAFSQAFEVHGVVITGLRHNRDSNVKRYASPGWLRATLPPRGLTEWRLSPWRPVPGRKSRGRSSPWRWVCPRPEQGDGFRKSAGAMHGTGNLGETPIEAPKAWG